MMDWSVLPQLLTAQIIIMTEHVGTVPRNFFQLMDGHVLPQESIVIVILQMDCAIPAVEISK
jgi:hypothetical protein